MIIKLPFEPKIGVLCLVLACVTLFPHWLAGALVAAGAYWIAQYAVRTEMRGRAVPIGGTVIDDEA